jgi:hypothetical protein
MLSMSVSSFFFFEQSSSEGESQFLWGNFKQAGVQC